MKFSKVREVKSPNRGTSLSAGIDFFVPEFKEDFINDLKNKNPEMDKFFKIIRDENTMSATEIVLDAQGRILIPSGIHVNLRYNMEGTENVFDVGVALIAHNKSGIGTKKGLDRLAEVVDEDYQGEIHISVVNTGKYPITISPNEKLIQFLMMPVFYEIPEELPFNELYSIETDRGNKGFGEGTGL